MKLLASLIPQKVNKNLITGLFYVNSYALWQISLDSEGRCKQHKKVYKTKIQTIGDVKSDRHSFANMPMMYYGLPDGLEGKHCCTFRHNWTGANRGSNTYHMVARLWPITAQGSMLKAGCEPCTGLGWFTLEGSQAKVQLGLYMIFRHLRLYCKCLGLAGYSIISIIVSLPDRLIPWLIAKIYNIQSEHLLFVALVSFSLIRHWSFNINWSWPSNQSITDWLAIKLVSYKLCRTI